ncbi:hypothetical protein K502DRAFT_345964 [Neoconidiobolus thromboides FSU 785]|nr:hypothetical protein K502DRAFT_345964 [Neoconidiobolus thromboides FSU 785]
MTKTIKNRKKTNPSTNLSNSSNPSNSIEKKTTSYNSFQLSILSGIYASLASVVGKLSTDPKTNVLISTFCQVTKSHLCERLVASYLLPVLRIIFFILMFTLNGLMWTTYTKALSSANSSIQVSVVNNATNMVTTAVLGYLIFNEVNGMLWWLGVSLVISGTVVLNKVNTQE